MTYPIIQFIFLKTLIFSLHNIVQQLQYIPNTFDRLGLLTLSTINNF